MNAPAGDWDKKGQDLDQRFAKFCLRPLSEEDVWALSMAAMVMPDGSPGAEAYLTQVAGVTAFSGRLTLWGRVVAIGIAEGRHKLQHGHRRRKYVEGYDESWGRYAVADGLTLALFGWAEMNAADRVSQLKCGRQGYERIRDFVGGALVSAIAEYRSALAWATGFRRDRVFEGRWEGITGLKWSEALSDARMSCAVKSRYPIFAPGCARTVPLKDIERDGDWEQPETLYHGLRPTDWWDSAVAAQARKWPVTTIYPASEPSRVATDE